MDESTSFIAATKDNLFRNKFNSKFKIYMKKTLKHTCRKQTPIPKHTYANLEQQQIQIHSIQSIQDRIYLIFFSKAHLKF